MTGNVSAQSISEIVIAGGGFTGWTVALRLASFCNRRIRIRLIESDDPLRSPIAEHLSPHFTRLHKQAGRTDAEFLRLSQGTYSVGWSVAGLNDDPHPVRIPYNDSHSLTLPMGLELWDLWLRAKREGQAYPTDSLSLTLAAFTEPQWHLPHDIDATTSMSLETGFHVDSALYAKHLKKLAMQNGVELIEGVILDCERRENGSIRALRLDDGRIVGGDLYCDCTDTRALLASDFMQMPRADWSHWFPENRLIYAPTGRMSPLPIHTQAVSHAAGFSYKFPLQYRTANALTYSDAFLQESTAEEIFKNHCGEPPLSLARQSRYHSSICVSPWTSNVVALGKSAGMIDPCCPLNNALLYFGIEELLRLFPDRTVSMPEQTRYNHRMNQAFTEVLDVLTALRHFNNRPAEPFWQYLKGVRLPDTLQHRLSYYEEHGRTETDQHVMFSPLQWTLLWMGLNHYPKAIHPVAAMMSAQEISERLTQQENWVRRHQADFVSHEVAIQKTCRA
jgi:tryptophan halogenase